jgi:toxin ParE1/3/4
MYKSVIFLEPAIKDIESIYDYLEETAGSAIALNKIKDLEIACDSLTQKSERGRIPRELERIGISDYRQIISDPYRIIYQVVNDNVYIFGIIHGKRNVQDVLKRRLLRSLENF